MLPRAFDREPLVVEKLLDFQHQLHVLAAVQTMALAGFLRAERRKFRLPEPQHVGLDACQPADFANAEVQFIRDLKHLIFSRGLQHNAAILSKAAVPYTGSYETAATFLATLFAARSQKQHQHSGGYPSSAASVSRPKTPGPRVDCPP